MVELSPYFWEHDRCHAHMIFVLTQQVFLCTVSAILLCFLVESLQEAFSTSLSILVSTISVRPLQVTLWFLVLKFF